MFSSKTAAWSLLQAYPELLDERFLIYNALTSASNQLWVSYPAADDEGKTLLPSEVIRHLKLMFQMEEVPLFPRPHAGQSASEQEHYATRPDKTLAYLTGRLRDWRNGEEIPDFWWHVYNWYAEQPELRPRLSSMLSSLSYRNEARPLKQETSRQLYGTKRGRAYPGWSALLRVRFPILPPMV